MDTYFNSVESTNQGPSWIDVKSRGLNSQLHTSHLRALPFSFFPFPEGKSMHSQAEANIFCSVAAWNRLIWVWRTLPADLWRYWMKGAIWPAERDPVPASRKWNYYSLILLKYYLQITIWVLVMISIPVWDFQVVTFRDDRKLQSYEGIG